MVIWGIVFGAILGLLWRGHDWETHLTVGAVLGAIAGITLRTAIRKEVKAALAARQQHAAVQPAVAQPAAGDAPIATGAPVAVTPPPVARPLPAEPVPLRAEDFNDTQPLPEPGTRAAPPRPRPAPVEDTEPNFVTALVRNAIAWFFGGNTVVRAGVLILFVGLAFLAKYAMDNSLLPPELRLAGIAAAGIALFAGGMRLRAKAPGKLAYALTLQGAGVAVMYLSVFAAFRLYQFLPAGAAFAALGLVCAFAAVIAVAQNAMPMAFIGFAGGFAAPILVSTGQGNHVGLFSYYLLLGVAIAALSWVKAWRPLNLLGFFATFGVAAVWGVQKYQPENFGTTEPFLIAFFLVYLAASLMYALRHSLGAKRAVDATLIFGNPLIAFGLQAALVRDIDYATAFSSLAMGALYLALGWWMVRPREGRTDVHRWLAECFLALGLGFATLAVPLALDASWTSAVWAVEGAGVYWMGRRQLRWLARAAGLALQVLAAIAFMESRAWAPFGAWPFANPAFIGCTMLAAAAFAISFMSRERAAPGDGFQAFAGLEQTLSPILFWIGFLWWQYGLHAEIVRAPMDANMMPVPVLQGPVQIHLTLVAWVASAFALHHLALPTQARPWRVAATPAYTVLPAMFMAALVGAATMDHVFKGGGWITWPLVLVLHAVMLRRLDAGPPQGWWSAVHAGGVWLLVLLGGNVLVFAVGKAALWQTAWASVILLVSAMVVLLLLSRRAWFDAARADGPWWPLNRFGRSYLWIAAAPLAVAVALGCLVVAVSSDGNAKPLPYIPLINPTDLAIALGLAACAMWLARVRTSAMPVPPMARDARWPLVLAAIAFVAINTVWLRVVHHFAKVPWDAHDLFASFLVQAGYSILWTLIALGLMIGSHRRALRSVWMLGAGLLGLTVLKLFVIDLSNRGGSERIFVFIAVGVLMLVVGYFAPLPPADKRKPSPELQGAAP